MLMQLTMCSITIENLQIHLDALDLCMFTVPYADSCSNWIS